MRRNCVFRSSKESWLIEKNVFWISFLSKGVCVCGALLKYVIYAFVSPWFNQGHQMMQLSLVDNRKLFEFGSGIYCKLAVSCFRICFYRAELAVYLNFFSNFIWILPNFSWYSWEELCQESPRITCHVNREAILFLSWTSAWKAINRSIQAALLDSLQTLYKNGGSRLAQLM